ncbi:MAG: hypothetical protein AAGM84_09570 [Pseudomonadota bacterium]
MTEITAKKSVLMPDVTGARYVIDPVAFAVSLIGGPLMVTALTFWILGIPVAALIFGGPAYVILGTPLLLWHLRRNVGEGNGIAVLALVSVAVPCCALAGLGVLLDNGEFIGIAAFYGFFGAIFAPAWAGGFAFLYNRLRNDLSRRPLLI